VRFGFEQRWEADSDDVLAVYIDSDFWTSLDGLTKTSVPDVLEVKRTGDTALVRLRYVLTVELPSQASRFIDPDDVAWVEETTWQLTARTGQRGSFFGNQFAFRHNDSLSTKERPILGDSHLDHAAPG
jgi:hypothetical protein